MNATSFMLEQENADLRQLVRQLKIEIRELKDKLERYERKE